MVIRRARAPPAHEIAAGRTDDGDRPLAGVLDDGHVPVDAELCPVKHEASGGGSRRGVDHDG
jgi:hypothetical protein